ncbi:YkgB family protein [Streptomyces sp. SYSU K217416]
MGTRPSTLESVGAWTLRSALVGNLVWIGALKFEDYEVENIHPLVSSSPLFSPLVNKLGEEKTARLIGVTEIAIGSLIAARPFAPRASALGSLGAVGMFVTTLSFLATTPEAWQENRKTPKLSMVGQFLAKDTVFLGASLMTLAESLRAARRS